MVPPYLQLRSKCTPAPYLFQLRGRRFDTTNIIACLRVLLHGVEVSVAQGETVRPSRCLVTLEFVCSPADDVRVRVE